MRTDPRKACKNEKERRGWAFLHDLLAHPFMAVTLWARASIRFHNWTSLKAWPREKASLEWWPMKVLLKTEHWGLLTATEIARDVWSIDHPTVLHTIRVTDKRGGASAIAQATKWFDELAEEHGGKFSRLTTRKDKRQ